MSMQDHKYFYLYSITNKTTGKIYVGVHKTSNLDDGYMGSGVAIKNAIKKYGIDNFYKHIIKFFESEKAMYDAEAEIVTEEFVKSKKTYNMKLGGIGGFPKHNTAGAKNGFYGKSHSRETRLKISIKSSRKRGPRGPRGKTLKMCGANNPRYGKIAPNAKSVIINGVLYKSIKIAAKALNINYSTLKGRVKAGYYKCQD
ncbi:NUMOD3 domain-containing DNA-binding protein [Escherichia coli]|uniref:Homing endonuclease n=5 Tax=Tequatrovirus TaxID=10663 RepID=A0A4Y6EAY1_9CAUD|nr:NUMOD3 domain-containing DNA-binding protein [Escherichia coli]QDF15176.1 homing endonuclease [Escherichia phage vB_EcoM-Sa45lw]QXV84995.1 putative homing endonuclease [Escherichia phage TadeuszReichstein]URY15601.1 homing endonuclease [Shigella phage ESh33]URY15782.1 homing endonuclease [Shigella phage ESH35]